MTVEQEVFTELNGDATFSAHFNVIDVMDVPSGTSYPYLTIRQVDDPSTPLGLKESSSGEARIQMSVFSNSKYECIEKRAIVRDRARELTGSSLKISARVSNEAMLDLNEDGYYEGIVDVIVTWNE
jgi:hypothetical protein